MPDVLPISVVIPAFNQERYIGEALRSVFGQTRPPAQVIVVDDGSTERTADVAASCGATVIRQPNGGVSQARNRGIGNSTQPWLAFQDADDIWLPRKLELQWAALGATPEAGWSFSDRTAVDESGRDSGGLFATNRRYAALTKKTVSSEAVGLDRDELGAALFHGNFIHPSSLVARRDLIESIGLFPEDMRYCEDLDLLLRLSAASSAVAVIVPLVTVRIHRAGASRARGKMQLGRASIADRVAARPERYPQGALEFFMRDRPARLHRAGTLFMRQGDFAEAARAMRASLGYRFSVGAAASFALARVLAALRADAAMPLVRNAWRRFRGTR